MPEKVGFPILVDRLAEAFGQEARRVKKTDEATYLLTPDGFLYAFFETPGGLTTTSAQGLLDRFPKGARYLVVLSPHALGTEVRRTLEDGGASVVSGERFHHLLESLDLAWTLGEEPPRPPPEPTERRALPTADLLDAIMARAQTWLDWGVPAIALRFLEQALTLKPEYRPALIAMGTARLGLDQTDLAREAFESALRIDPSDLGARLGLARVLGLQGDGAKEIAALRKILAEDPSQLTVRAHLIAALVSAGHWSEAAPEIKALIEVAPEEARFHALLSVVLEKVGDSPGSKREEKAARSLGMSMEELDEVRASVRASHHGDSGRTSSRAKRAPAKSK